MIILRNKNYSSPYFGGGYDDLEERLFGMPFNSGMIGKTFKTATSNPTKKMAQKVREVAKGGKSDINEYINKKFPNFYISWGGEYTVKERLKGIKKMVAG